MLKAESDSALLVFVFLT